MSKNVQYSDGARRRRKTTPRARALFAVALAAVIAGSAAGGAFAYFLGGSGTGTGTTATLSNLVITSTVTDSGLYPGSSSPIYIKVTNSNSSSLKFSSVSLDTSQGTGGFSVTPASGLTCSVANAALSFPTQSTGWTVPGSTSNFTISMATASIFMGTAATSGCQGAAVTVYVLVS